MALALLPGDPLEVAHICRVDRRTDDTEVVNLRYLASCLVIPYEQLNVLDVLKLDISQIHRVSLQIFWAQFQILNACVALGQVEIQSFRLVDEDLYALWTLVGGPLHLQAVYLHGLIKCKRYYQLLITVRLQKPFLGLKAVGERVIVVFVQALAAVLLYKRQQVHLNTKQVTPHANHFASLLLTCPEIVSASPLSSLP